MKRYALLLLLVLGLSTSAWGTQIGMGCVNPCLGMGQWPCWNPCPTPCPQPNPCPNPCPTPCPQPNPCPNPCPGTCPLPTPNLCGGLEATVGLKHSAFHYAPVYGCGTPCFPFAIVR